MMFSTEFYTWDMMTGDYLKNPLPFKFFLHNPATSHRAGHKTVARWYAAGIG